MECGLIRYSEFMDSSVFAILVKVALFTLMLAIGVNLTWEKLIPLWRNPIIPTLIAYMILGAIVAVPYSLWSKRQLAKLPQNSAS